MTLLIVIILVAILIVVGIYLIKRTAKNEPTGNAASNKPVHTSGSSMPSTNPGSVPDKPGAKGDGGSALSSGQQG